MRRLFGTVLRLIVGLAFLAAVLWYGILGYYKFVHPIAGQVRQDVLDQLQAHHGKYLNGADIPVVYRNAVIATEDRSFETNIGVDFAGIARAALVDLLHGQLVQGGSTITQQLVHNTLMATNRKTFWWKVMETIDAVGLNDTMNKQEIFTLYANGIYFGHDAYGLQQAAVTYFGRPPGDLNEGELAMLAGIPNAPSDYDPFVNYRLARQRQSDVIRNMVEAGMISDRQAAQIRSQPIRLNATKPKH